jgi:hypothetical protein
MLSRLTWYGYRAAERMTWLGWLGLLSTLLALTLYVVWVMPKQTELNVLQTDRHAPVQQVQADPQQQLQAYLQTLPSSQQRGEAVQSVIDVAEAQGLQMDEVVYKTKTLQDDPILHYSMQFSLYAGYGDIQAFLSSLLHQIDTVSIESLSLQREHVRDDIVEARIRLVLHFNAVEGTHAD